MFGLDDLKKSGIVVNPNAKGNTPSFTITKPTQQQESVDDDESFLERTKRGVKETFVDMPIAMKKAFTGEDKPVEFPNLREITKLDDIGSNKPHCILSNQSIIIAKKKMHDNNISSLVVIENNEPIGTLVLEDLIL